MHKKDRIPFVHANMKVKDALLIISEKGFGMTTVLNASDEMVESLRMEIFEEL